MINIIFEQRTKLEPNSSNKHILFLKFIESNKSSGHYNIIHIKENINIKEMIKNIQLIIDGKYYYHILQKINQITDYLFNQKSFNKELLKNNSSNNNLNTWIGSSFTISTKNINSYNIKENKENLQEIIF